MLRNSVWSEVVNRDQSWNIESDKNSVDAIEPAVTSLFGFRSRSRCPLPCGIEPFGSLIF